MNIALRKQKILAAVIENYIASGEPIGSKALMEGMDVSSATIRNELADLTARGFLRQPHTSAGRVPTQLGYRYYIDNLMKPAEPDDRVKRYIENRLTQSSDAPENILKAAGEAASELLGTVAMSTAPSGKDSRVYRIKFVRTGRHTSMLVLITSQGMVKSRLFRCDFDITPEMLNVFDRALNEKLAGQPLSGVNRAFAQSFAASFGELGLLMPDMLLAVMDACAEAGSAKVYVSGATKLLYQNELDLISARSVLEFVSDDRQREKLLTEVPDGTEIFVGTENRPVQLRKCSEVVTGYSIENKPAGSIAVIGSMRMDYSVAVSVLEYIAEVAGELIDEIISKES